MQILDVKTTVSDRAPGSLARSFRLLAAPAAVLLVASLIGFAPTSADAATRGTLTASPAGAFATLAGKRTNSKTVVNITIPASRSLTAAVQLRSSTTAKGYRAKALISSDGSVRVGLSRVIGGKETALASSVDTGLRVTSGETIRLQGAIAGTSPVRLLVRAWKAGAKAPIWRLGATDSSSSRIKKAGKTRLWVYRDSGTSSVAFAKASTAKVSVRAVKSSKVASPSNSAAGTPPTTSLPDTSGKPNASTTGVKAGTTLTRHDGNIVVTADNTVLANLDIHGFVTVRAKNVTISNSIVRGGRSTGTATGLIVNYGYAGLLITDTDVRPEFPSVWFDGIKGSDFTARRVHVDGGVDSVKIHGSNVTIEDSLLENTDYFASDPQQGGGPTHNDNIQILYGTNLKITGNTIRGASNFAVLGGATRGNTNVAIQNNWLDGGHCTVKLQILNGYSETAKVTGNKFGPNRLISSCAFTAYPAVSLTQSGNTYELTGGAVKPLLLVS